MGHRMKKNATGLYHNQLDSVKNTLTYARLAVAKKKQEFAVNGIYLITFTDSEYIRTKSGFDTVKIIIEYNNRFSALLAYWTLDYGNLPFFRLDFTANTTRIFNIDHDMNLINSINLGNCETDNINLNLNNFVNYLRMQVYDDIKINRIVDKKKSNPAGC